MKDMTGKEVKVGDYVSYALAVTRDAIMCIFQVTSIHANGWAGVRYVGGEGGFNGVKNIEVIGSLEKRSVVLVDYKEGK